MDFGEAVAEIFRSGGGLMRVCPLCDKVFATENLMYQHQLAHMPRPRCWCGELVSPPRVKIHLISSGGIVAHYLLHCIDPGGELTDGVEIV